METSAFFTTYLTTLVICLVITIWVISLLNNGLKKFFGHICQDQEVSDFFVKITRVVIFLGGISGALAATYNTGEQSNWLTMTWDSAGQVKGSLQQLFITVIILSITFFILFVLDKKINK